MTYKLQTLKTSISWTSTMAIYMYLEQSRATECYRNSYIDFILWAALLEVAVKLPAMNIHIHEEIMLQYFIQEVDYSKSAVPVPWNRFSRTY